VVTLNIEIAVARRRQEEAVEKYVRRNLLVESMSARKFAILEIVLNALLRKSKPAIVDK
jgi:hypothetical protein